MTTNDDIPKLEVRPGIMKCAGAGLEACSRCTRLLAPAAELDQRWVSPEIHHSKCYYFADVTKYAPFYQPLPEQPGKGL